MYYIKLIVFKYRLRISRNVNIGYISSNTYACNPFKKFLYNSLTYHLDIFPNLLNIRYGTL